MNGHEAFKRALPAAEQELNSMVREANEVNQLVQQHDLPRQVAVNPYTMVSHEVRLHLLPPVVTPIVHKASPLQSLMTHV